MQVIEFNHIKLKFSFNLPECKLSFKNKPTAELFTSQKVPQIENINLKFSCEARA
jgi:hypothetical protein